MTGAITPSGRAEMSDHEQMLDAQQGCVPCKLCGGHAVISDAGIGAGYYIKCSNSRRFRDSAGCLLDERRLGGWAYNVRDWWNRLQSPTASLSAPEMGGVERCPECGCREQARVQERKPDGKFGDGPLVRCVNCKRTWPSPSPAVAEVVAVLESIQMLKRSIMIDVGSCHSMRGPGASSEMREDDRELRRDIEAAFAKIDTLLATLRGRGL